MATNVPRSAPPASAAPSPLRLAVIADVHGNLAALEAVLAALRGADPGLLVHLGDCASGPLWPRETLALLRGHSGGGAPSPLLAAARTARGNHDRWVAEGPGAAGFGPSDAFAAAALADTDGAAWLGALPAAVEPAPGVAAFHGRPGDDNAYLLEDVVAGALAPAAPAEVTRRLQAPGAGGPAAGPVRAQPPPRAARPWRRRG